MMMKYDGRLKYIR